jgi:hypothetical protein
MEVMVMGEASNSPITQNRSQKLLPRIIFVAAIVLSILPFLRTWSLVVIMVTQNETGLASVDIAPIELGRSQHFILLGPTGYLSNDEIREYLSEAETRRAELIEYLGINDTGTQVTVRLHPQWGIADFGSPASIDIYAFQIGRNGLIHELTHLLMGYYNSFLSEGLAVMTEERYGWNLAFPNFLRPVDACLYAFLRDSNDFSPLSTLANSRRLWNPSKPELSQLYYLQAGSFARYLIQTYGLSAYLDVYRSPDFKDAYGRSLAELEGEWLAFVRRGHLIQAWMVAAGGTVVLGLAHLALSQGKSWALPAVAGWFCFTAWSFYLAYLLRVPGALLATIIIGGITGRWRCSWGLVVLWALGMISLVFFILWPPLVNYFGGGIPR